MGAKLLIATNNQGKLAEYRSLLKDLHLELVGLDEAGISSSVKETGKTFEENAILKATAYAAESSMVALADDSGLEVDSLGGEPGVRSARYAGANASDEDRIAFLLSKLKDVPWEKRAARFRCVIAVSTPDGEAKTCEGECPGIIALESKGKQGFGYDPVFFLPAFNKTMAELPPEIKNQISHRGRAARQVGKLLRKRPFKLLFRGAGENSSTEADF